MGCLKLPEPLFKTSVVYKWNYDYRPHYDVIVNQGGSWSGKTYSILQVLATIALECKPGTYKHKVISVVGRDVPHLKRGALRDFSDIVADCPTLQAAIKQHNKSDRVYTLHNGFVIEFLSVADLDDAKGGKRDYLFINEANFMSWEVYEQLSLRTLFTSYIDYNPSVEFWAHTNLIGHEGVKLVVSDHRHNPFLEQKIHDRVEGILDYESWKVYARGARGKLEGAIFSYDTIWNRQNGRLRIVYSKPDAGKGC
jgi:phage terminase large subunit